MGLTRCPGDHRGCIATKIPSYLPFTLISVREMAARGLHRRRLLVKRRELARCNVCNCDL
jgi:hypothetical protein